MGINDLTQMFISLLQDGMFTLELAGEGEVKLSCPSSVDQSFPHPNYPQNPVFPLPPTIALQPRPMFPHRPTPPPKPQAPLHPYYTKPAEKPKPATLPPGNPHYYFSFYPQPAKPVTHPPVTQKPATEKPTAPLHPYHTEPATHPPVNPQYYFSFYPLPATPPPAIKVPQGHVLHPYYRHPKPVTVSPLKDPQIPWEFFYPQPAKPVTPKPTPAMLPPATEKPKAPLHPYYPHHYQQFYPEPAKPITILLRPATQTPEQTPLVVHTWTPASQQPSHPRTTKAPPTVAPTLPQPGDSYPPNSGYCPTICPTGFLTCCPMPISFHQHHHNHFGPVTSKDGVIIPAYPIKHSSDLFNYASFSGPTQATTTPQPTTVQTVAPTIVSLTGFHDYWSQHGMRFSASLTSYAQAPSDANMPSEPQHQKQSHFQPYSPKQPMTPYFEAPASDSNKPTAQQRPILPHNPQWLRHAYPLPYNPQGPVQPHGQAPVYSNKPLDLERPASDPSKPSEPQSLSSDLNKPLKRQPSKWPHYPFRPPMWYDPDMFYASKPLTQPDHNHLSESAMQMHSTLDQLSPQEHPHGTPQPPRPVKELGGSLPVNSEGISSLQQPNPSGQQMPTHYGSWPIYYAGSKPSYPQKPAAKPSGKPSRPEFPESFEHYWKPIVPLESNEGFHGSYPAQSAGGSYPAAN